MSGPAAAPEPPGRGLRPGELSSVALAFGGFFLLLCSYYILRPVRDTMGVQTGVEHLHWLFTGTFVFTLVTVPLFGAVVKRVRRARLLPAVYGFVIANLLGFAAAFAAGAGTAAAAAFFIWLSVFNLFVVSLFWSKVSDSFSTEQSHRLYGYIAAGGTVGALAGPALTAALARHVDTAVLLLCSAALLAAAALCLSGLRRGAPRAGDEAAARPIGGAILAGVSLTLKLPNLRAIALLVICYSAVSTVLYVELADAVGRRYADSGVRTAFFAGIDLTVNALTLTLQLLGTRRIVQRSGLRAALSLVPALVLTGLTLLTAWRGALPLAAVQTLHRAGDYALMRPGREMIYTTVNAESRYKAKNFIDTAVYRANDAASAWLVALLRGAGLDAVALLGLPAALLWLLTGFRVGRRHDRHEPT